MITVGGKLFLHTEGYTVEYEPESQTGSNTLYLRVTGNNHNVPIYLSDIDSVIEMLQRGKSIIKAAREWGE